MSSSAVAGNTKLCSQAGTIPCRGPRTALTQWDTDLQGRSSARKDQLGDPAATKLTMSQHCTLVAQAQQEPRSQQATAFSMEHLMGTFLWHCLHRTRVLPDTQHLGILLVLVTLPDKSILPCTPEQNTKLCDLQLPQAAAPAHTSLTLFCAWSRCLHRSSVPSLHTLHFSASPIKNTITEPANEHSALLFLLHSENKSCSLL